MTLSLATPAQSASSAESINNGPPVNSHAALMAPLDLNLPILDLNLAVNVPLAQEVEFFSYCC